jgi:antitoxin VapB
VPRTAKIFMNNRSQAVRLPEEFQIRTSEVFIRRSGNDMVLSPRPAYFAEGPVAAAELMSGVEDLPVQERKSCFFTALHDVAFLFESIPLAMLALC